MPHEIDVSTGKPAIAYVGETPWPGLGEKLSAASIQTWLSAGQRVSPGRNHGIAMVTADRFISAHEFVESSACLAGRFVFETHRFRVTDLERRRTRGHIGLMPKGRRRTATNRQSEFLHRFQLRVG